MSRRPSTPQLRKSKMSVQIIRSRDQVYSAPIEVLTASYRELRGEPEHPGFGNIDAARVAVSNAILAAEDVVAHAGVPRGVAPVAKTVRELGYNPYAPGTMSHELYSKIAEQQPIERRAPADAAAAPGRVTIQRVRATGAGTSKVQPGSVRAAVLARVQASPRQTATVAELEKHFGHPVRGYLQKLIEKQHLVIVQENQQ